MTPEAWLARWKTFSAERAMPSCSMTAPGSLTWRSKYSISGEHNKCLLHLWSAERNLVRRVLDAEVRMEAAAGGAAAGADASVEARNLPGAIGALRRPNGRAGNLSAALAAGAGAALPRISPSRLSNAMDLERSFGPIYARGLLRQARTAFAVLGVNQQETQASIDAALTFGILWLDACRN